MNAQRRIADATSSIPCTVAIAAKAAGQRLMLASADGSWIVDMPDMNGGYAGTCQRV